MMSHVVNCCMRLEPHVVCGDMEGIVICIVLLFLDEPWNKDSLQDDAQSLQI